MTWFQPRTGNDAFSAGYRFTLEFALTRDPIVYGNGYRARLPTLLTEEERQELRHMETERSRDYAATSAGK